MDSQIKLKPGFLDQRYNDDPSDPLYFIDERYTDSMAKAMEDAFMAIWPKIIKTDAPKINNHFRMMFVAIAQGVVQHIVKNGKAISVSLDTKEDHRHKIEDYNNGIFNHHHEEDTAGGHTHVTIDVNIAQEGTLNL